MTAPNSAGTILDRIRRALDLIEQASDAATQGDRAIQREGGVFDGEGYSQISVDFGAHVNGGLSGPGCVLHDGEAAEADARLIKASGPNHWRALRVILVQALENQRLTSEAAAALMPLVNQVLNDLGTPDEASGFWLCRYPGVGGEPCHSMVREDERAAHLAAHGVTADALSGHVRGATATGQQP